MASILIVALQTPEGLPPLSVTTLAALTPDLYSFTAHWEWADGPFAVELGFDYDIVGFTYYGSTEWHLDDKVCEWARQLRERGVTVVIGGPAASAKPEVFRNSFDVVFVGEAEKTWPEFLADYLSGSTKKEYRQVLPIDLSESPPPRWDVLSTTSRITYGMMQTTRGCPFDCEFCDVIQLVGRTPRHKTVQQLQQELRRLPPRTQTVWICDDELFADRRWTKTVLSELIEHNKTRAQPLTFMAQGTLNVAKDAELMSLLADANVWRVMIGLESTTKAGLESINKRHNIRNDFAAEVQKPLRLGVGIVGMFIWGIDGEGSECCQAVHNFALEVGLPAVQIATLQATPKTRLWTRLRKEGRLLDPRAMTERYQKSADRLSPPARDILLRTKGMLISNVLFKNTKRAELFEQMWRVLPQIYDWSTWTERICTWMSLIERQPAGRWVDPAPFERKLASTLRATGADAADALKAVEKALTYARQKAAVLVPSVCEYALLNIGYREKYQTFAAFASMCQEIEQEWTQEDYEACLMQDRITIPAQIEQAYSRELFPTVYRRTYLNLNDGSKLGEALSEIFFDFVFATRGSEDTSVPNQLRILADLGDRVCAKLNSTPPELFQPILDQGQVIPDHRGNRIHDWVLRDVQNEISRASSRFEVA
ncbi:MAG TPA: radical SAM protein [Steroidobacteraceae bacterium]|nr:radical SAM protein [Steroidobacteraceae bacterium]